MNKRILYIGLTDIDDKYNGVTQKVKSQIDSLKSLGYECIFAGYKNNQIIINDKVLPVKNSKLRRYKLMKEVLSHLSENAYDYLYLRYPHTDYMVIKVLKEFKRKGTKVFLEFPTYPIKYPISSLSSIVHLINSKIFNKYLKKYVDKSISIGTQTNKIFGIDNISVPNGFNQSNIDCFNIPEMGSINIVSASHFYDVHGYDRLIKGMGRYYQQDGEKVEISLNLIGDGPEKENLVKLVKANKLEDKVIFHGIRDSQTINEMLSKSNMGCGPLAAHRSNLIFASPLKTKDYFKNGIPFICSYNEIMVPDNYPYIHKFVSNESDINIDEIVEFFKTYKYDYKTHSDQMRQYGLDYLTWVSIMEGIFRSEVKDR